MQEAAAISPSFLNIFKSIYFFITTSSSPNISSIHYQTYSFVNGLALNVE
jgi:hypothetical protein